MTDAYIWIDLDNGGLTAVAFSLPYDFAAPDAVVHELGPELGGRLRGLGLQILGTPPEEQPAWGVLRARHRLPSDADLYALLHAQLAGARLITGDRDLRRAAEAERVGVNGLLWLLRELVNRNLVTKRAARHSLGAIREQGARLPLDECEQLMKEWR